MSIIELRNATRRYDDNFVALKGVNLEIGSGRFYSLLGPSGSRKTTILRIIASFTEVTSSQILFDGQDTTNLDAFKRHLNAVFQNYALLPYLDVYENVAFALKLKKRPESEIRQAVKEALHTVRLDGYANREIFELSGEQQQRVTIARAIINKPRILLLDESLSALDERLRKEMQFELWAIQKKLGITFISVAHDQEEVLVMGDKIFVLDEGQIQQSGTPVGTYDEPVNGFVTHFIEDPNIVPGRMVQDYEVESVNKHFECTDTGINPREKVEVVPRSEDLDIVEPDKGKLIVTVESQLFLDDRFEIKTHDADENKWLVHSTNPTEAEKEAGVFLDPEGIHVMQFGESGEEFDARLEKYEGEDDNEE